ncbi:uncharacterized protein TNCV_1188611 [Trichonephila clavipes]|nr:uncharacterized protein TNCV_1188611 [Trichonephila clavipes]
MRVNFYDARAHRHGGENALSRNKQNVTDHCHLQNSQENISLHFPEEGTPGFEPEACQSAVECSTTELYTRVRKPLLSVGTDTKMRCLEIYRTGQIIPAFEILKKLFFSTSLKKGTSWFELGTSQLAVEGSTTELYPPIAAVAEWYRYRTVACLVTSSSPVPLKNHRVGQRCTLNLSRAETSSRWCGVVVRRGGACSGVVPVN